MTAKYANHFVYSYTKPKEANSWSPVYRPGDRTKILRLDKRNMKQSKMFVECTWFWPQLTQDRSLEQRSTKPHLHDYDEVLGIVGTNRDDPHDLGGESEVYIGGERHVITKSCLLYLPAGVEHGPFREVNMKNPIFHFESRSLNCE